MGRLSFSPSLPLSAIIIGAPSVCAVLLALPSSLERVAPLPYGCCHHLFLPPSFDSFSDMLMPQKDTFTTNAPRAGPSVHFRVPKAQQRAESHAHHSRIDHKAAYVCVQSYYTLTYSTIQLKSGGAKERCWETIYMNG